MTSSPYDTAAVAMALDDAQVIDWLLVRQYKDGSWGGHIPFRADRLLQTMMVVRSLLFLQRWQPSRTILQDAISRGISFISDTLNQWGDDALEECDLAGFELLISTHHLCLRRDSVAIPALPLTLEKRWQRKLRLLPSTLSKDIPPSHVLHAIEALEGWADGQRLVHHIALTLDPTQLVGSSPSATAYLLRAGGLNEDQRISLKKTLRQAQVEDRGYPATTPVSSFTSLWKMYYGLSTGGDTTHEHAQVFDALIRCHRPIAGIGCNPEFIADADDTAIALLLAAKLGRVKTANILANALLENFYEVGSGFFRTYPFEMTVSISTNARVVEALRTAAPFLAQSGIFGSRYAKAYHSTAQFVLDNAWQRDKWHVSPYYAMHACSQALQTRGGLGGQCSWHQEKLQQLLDEQHSDGGWGISGTTCEETCYAALTLLNLAKYSACFQLELPLTRALLFLRSPNKTESTELWIDKTLYQPKAMLQGLFKATCAAISNYLLGLTEVTRQDHIRSLAYL
ncbi:hypothetical protein [Synechococcus sp. PCC 7335]|uniref:hypothetical protein n=1 Tax=Synechococcus sp. (strain ATCC 29403 / PCC 7335) TaxID=91464 RepID=UPI0012F94615|nr:hypothetical protein [Synechococcus sp. PCC 7335]